MTRNRDGHFCTRTSKAHNRGGSGADFLILLAFAGLLVIWLGARLAPASVDQVRALATQAQSNPDAKHLVVNALKTNPTPTVREVSELAEQVNDILVLSASKDISGDTTLQPSRQREERVAAQRLDSGPQIDRPRSRVEWAIIGAFIHIVVALGAFGLYKLVGHMRAR